MIIACSFLFLSQKRNHAVTIQAAEITEKPQRYAVLYLHQEQDLVLRSRQLLSRWQRLQGRSHRSWPCRSPGDGCVGLILDSEVGRCQAHMPLIA